MTTIVDKQTIETQQSLRAFVQEGGAVWGNPARFAGLDGAYMIVGDVTVPRGDVSNIPLYSPTGLRQYTSGGTQESSPDLATGTLTFLHQWGGIPREFLRGDCGLDVYLLRGDCAQLSNPHRGWKDWVTIYPNGKVTSETLPGMSWADDNMMEYPLDMTWRGAPYRYAQVTLAALANATVNAPVLSALFWNARDCGNCGPANNGASWRYAVLAAQAASPATLPRLIYTLDGGATVGIVAITGIGATENPYAVRQIGDKIVVFTKGAAGTAGAHYYATIGMTGVPSAFTKVTAGYVAAHPCNAVWVGDERTVIVVADDGYIYGSEDIAAGVSLLDGGNTTSNDLLAVDGLGQDVFAFGRSGTVVRSVQRGESWALAVAPDAGVDLTAGAINDGYYLWAGGATGGAAKLYVSKTAGESWEDASSIAGDMTEITAMKRVTRNVWMIAGNTATNARLLTTYMGGSTWASSHVQNSRILNFPAALAAINEIVTPNTGIPDLDVNYLMLPGDSAVSGDGLWVNGLPIVR